MLFRKLVAPRRSNCYTREQRRQVAIDIINEVQKLDPPGRFLMISPVDCSSLYEISYKKTITKVCQSLRNQNREKKSSLTVTNVQSSSDQNAHQGSFNITKVCQSLREQSLSDQHTESSNDDAPRLVKVASSPIISTSPVSSLQEGDKDLAKHAVSAIHRCDHSTKKQIIMPLSYIGSAFLETSDQCSDESKQLFQMLSNMANQDENGLLHLPGIVGSLCKHIDDLEKRKTRHNHKI